jgi:hypothetical protein
VVRAGPIIAMALLAACTEAPPEADAGSDAGPIDAFVPQIDAGPPPTGCDRLADGGMPPPLADGGPIDPAAFAPARGPGGPRTTFTTAQLNVQCATMDFGPTDEQHHNTGFVLDGYLVRPWAHERGRGGIAIFEIDEPCSPVMVANVLDDRIRETHSTGFSPIGGRWIAVAAISGIEFWDVSDIMAPVRVHEMALPDVRYPDSYMRVIMSVAWQAPYIYAGGSDNGVFVIDATVPTDPILVAQLRPEPFFRVGSVHAVGNLLVVMASEGARVALFDISVPDAPRPIAGGSFVVSNGTIDRLGRPVPAPAYFGMVSGGRTYHTRAGLGGGLVTYDISDPSAPTFLSNVDAPASNGGYVYLHEDRAFVGLSNYAMIYDVSDPRMPVPLAQLDLEGDLDTATPFGNVVILSVDDDSVGGVASSIVPWAEAPDARGPRVSWVVPSDGATARAVTTRVGLSFDEFVAMESVWRGSIQIRETGTTEPIDGWYSGQEGVVNFWPAVPLRPSTTYEVIVPAGGVTDITGNPTGTDFRSTFTTVACPP